MTTYEREDFNFGKYKAFFAFGDDQLEEAKKKYGITDNKELVSLGMGLIALKSNYKEMLKDMNEHDEKERKRRIEIEGIDNIILYELKNHEVFYSGDYSEIIEMLKEYGATEKRIHEIYKEELQRQIESGNL